MNSRYEREGTSQRRAVSFKWAEVSGMWESKRGRTGFTSKFSSTSRHSKDIRVYLNLAAVYHLLYDHRLKSCGERDKVWNTPKEWSGSVVLS